MARVVPTQTMKTEKQIKERIKMIESAYGHVLTGDLSNIQINAPRALIQVDAEARLSVLYWAIGKEFKSKLKSSQ